MKLYVFSKLVFKELALLEDITLNMKNIDKDIYLRLVVGIFVTHVLFNKFQKGIDIFMSDSINSLGK